MLNLSNEQKNEVIKDLEVFCALGAETEKKLVNSIFTMSQFISIDNFGTPLDKNMPLNVLTVELEKLENTLEAANTLRELLVNQ